MRLLPDYRLQPLQGMDSIVGQISKPDGLTIQYEIGRIPKPDRVGMGGDFSDQPLLIPTARREWYKEQTIGGEPQSATDDLSRGEAQRTQCQLDETIASLRGDHRTPLGLRH